MACHLKFRLQIAGTGQLIFLVHKIHDVLTFKAQHLPHAVIRQRAPQRGGYRQLVAGRRGNSAPKARRASDPSSGPISAPATITTNTSTSFSCPSTGRRPLPQVPGRITFLTPSRFLLLPSFTCNLDTPETNPRFHSHPPWHRLLCSVCSAASIPTNGAKRAANRPLLDTPPPRLQPT